MMMMILRRTGLTGSCWCWCCCCCCCCCLERSWARGKFVSLSSSLTSRTMPVSSEFRLRDPAEHRLSYVGDAANLGHGEVVGILLGTGPQDPAGVKALGVVVVDLHDLTNLRLYPVADFVDWHVREESEGRDGDVHGVWKPTVAHNRARNPHAGLLVKGLRKIALAEPVCPPQRRHIDVKRFTDDRRLDDVAVWPCTVVLGDGRNPTACDLIEVLHQLSLQEGASDDGVAMQGGLADSHCRDIVQIPNILRDKEECARLRAVAENGALGPILRLAIIDVHQVARRDCGGPPNGQRAHIFQQSSLVRIDVVGPRLGSITDDGAGCPQVSC